MFTKNKAREDLAMIHMPTAEFVQQTKDYTDNLYNNVQPTNNLNNIITDIQKQAFHQINANLNKADFNDAAAKFNIFLTLDDQIKNQFKAKVEARKGFDAGYIRKSREQGDTDNKEYFHYNLYTEQLLGDTIVQYPEVQEFIIAARKVYLASLQQIAQLLKERETKYPGIYDHFIRTSQDPHFFIRFLSYKINPDQDKEKKWSAKGHYDRGSMTIAHAESHAGLRIGHTEENIQEVIHQEGKAKYFLSAYFPRLIIKHWPETLSLEQQKLLAQGQKKEVIEQQEKERCGRHDVIQQKTNTTQQRRAIVSFFDALHEEEIPYEETHTSAK